jgi:glutamate-ammonia-ligase adenylyltransferase
VRRSTYLVLLLENPTAMLQLVELCQASPWIAEQIIRFPFLLDELLNSETLYIPYDVNKIHDQLRQYMLSLPAEDLEQQMDCLRRFKHTQILRVAASDITGVLPLMKVSDHLTNTATAIVAYATRLAWGYLTTRHGYPLQDGEQLNWEDFAIIAYGKLGGFELGYGSDLDLVFLHDAENIAELTHGDKAISCSEFYMRLAQRIIHILSVATSSGVLYEVDTRLRPSGGSGLLVSSIHGFINYQRHEAWTWEHQALVRARVITGSKSITSRFQSLRDEILMRQRDQSTLAHDINSMRKKMRDAIKKSLQPSHHQFDVDQGEGGIKDIEFIVQFGVLNWGHAEPKIFYYTDNIRILEAFAEYKLMTEADVKLLSDAYCRYREIVHRHTLQNDPPWINEDELLEYRDGVKKIWNRLFTYAS